MTMVLYAVAGSLLAVAGLILLYRVIAGPSLLDRVIASDVLLTTLIIVVGAEMTINSHTRTIPLMVVLAAVGVFGSISVARFVTRANADSASSSGGSR
jgi:multicomponent Na+:H+ antiporter subunit F